MVNILSVEHREQGRILQRVPRGCNDLVYQYTQRYPALLNKLPWADQRLSLDRIGRCPVLVGLQMRKLFITELKDYIRLSIF